MGQPQAQECKSSPLLKVVEQCQVSPPSVFIPPQSSLPLTFFDLIYVPFIPVQRLFFYSYNGTYSDFINTDLPNLKHSLSLTLQNFYPLAGTLEWPSESTKPHIGYGLDNSRGVTLTVAESNNLDFYNLAANNPRDVNDFIHLVPQPTPATKQATQTVPLMALQVTLFPNTGICIGITTHHVMGDERSTSHFRKSWASICKSLESDETDKPCLLHESLPCFNRSLISDPSNLETTYINDIASFCNITQKCYYNPRTPVAETDQFRATFVLGKEEIQKLKKLARDGIVTPPWHLTTFVVTCAYVWFCFTKMLAGDQQDDLDTEEIEHFGFPIDCRERLEPPVPETYFGNCLMGCAAEANKVDLIGKNGMAVAAEAIGNAIQSKINEGVLVGAENVISNHMKALSSNKRALCIAGSPKFRDYDTDFGWGRPTKVDSHTPVGVVLLSQCRDKDGGIEVGLVLDKLEMDAFASLFTNTLNMLS